MTIYVIKEGDEIQKVNSLDGHEDAQLIETLNDDPPHEFFKVENDQWVPDEAAAEAGALDAIERAYEAATEVDVKKVRKQIGIALLWQEVQRLKLAGSTNTVPATVEERRKMFPTLMAIVTLSGNTLNQVAIAIENRLWDRVRRMALWEAKSLLAEDAVRAAQTVEDKLAAAEVTWTE